MSDQKRQPKKIIYAENVDYWKTGRARSAAQWIELAEKQLRNHGATHLMKADGEGDGRKCYMIAFQLAGMPHKIVWSVLPTRTDNEAHRRAADVQAATSLYHEVKNCCVVASRYGVARGFFQHRMLPDGRVLVELSAPEIAEQAKLLLPGPGPAGN